jgi:hypothetical protein
MSVPDFPILRSCNIRGSPPVVLRRTTEAGAQLATSGETYCRAREWSAMEAVANSWFEAKGVLLGRDQLSLLPLPRSFRAA